MRSYDVIALDLNVVLVLGVPRTRYRRCYHRQSRFLTRPPVVWAPNNTEACFDHTQNSLS